MGRTARSAPSLLGLRYAPRAPRPAPRAPRPEPPRLFDPLLASPLTRPAPPRAAPRRADKFTNFYPDLIDRTKTPRFTLEPAANREFVIIRFSAGPPYEDVAFQIVNREWDKGKKNGFKCVFGGGTLQLFFNFVRPRYRQ